MPAHFQDLTIPLPLGLAVLLAVVALVSYLVRMHGRRARRRSRGQDRALLRAIRMHLDGAPSGPLVQAVEAAEPGALWTALEFLSLKLTRPQWLRLSRALVRSRHAKAERQALADDSPWRRALAARRLGLLRSRVSRRALRHAMKRGPEMVTFAAATALARYRDLRALRWLLAHDSSLAHRHRNAMVALFRGFGRRGISVLAHALEHGIRNARVELAIVDALGMSAGSQARPLLEERLVKGNLDLRAGAARALGQLEAIECATSLIAALRDEAWQVRAQAARALGRVRAPLATQALAARLTDPSWWVRHHAAYALRELGEDGQGALRDVIATSPDPYARDMAEEALNGVSKRLSA